MSTDNRTRLIITIFDEPLMMLKNNQHNNYLQSSIPRGTILDPSVVEGYYVDLAYAIFKEKLNIPYKFIIETKYGKEIKQGIWDGIIGALANHTVDAAIASLTINEARAKVVDFSHPFIYSGISLMIQKPQEQKMVK
jgi:ABC-type amino acid transport substrate-binding protein